MTPDHFGASVAPASQLAEIEYTDFSIEIEPKQGGVYPVSVRSPAGEDRSSFTAPIAPGALAGALVELGRAVRGAPGEIATPAFETGTPRTPQQVGGELFEALFSGPVRTLFDRSQGMVEGPPRRGLRIKIHLDPDDPSLAELLSLPWEFLYRRENREFFGISKYTPVIRYLNVQRPSAALTLEPPLRILVAMASPGGCSSLDLVRERQLLERQLTLKGRDGADQIAVDFIEHATLEKLQERLRERVYHVLHFMGHGAFDEQTGQGVLLLEDDAARVAAVDGSALGDLLRDVPTLGLVFLNACDTARVASQQGADPFAGVAAALVLAGMRAVVAMQFQISDQAAITFAKTFYQLLASGSAVDYATAEGRKAIRLEQRALAEWGTPVLFMRVPHGVVFNRATLPPASSSMPPMAVAELAPQEPGRAQEKKSPRPPTGQTELTVATTETASSAGPPARPSRQKTRPPTAAKAPSQEIEPPATSKDHAVPLRKVTELEPGVSPTTMPKHGISRLSLGLVAQPSSVKEGGTVTWTITVTNSGDDDLREVKTRIGDLSLGVFALPVGESRQMSGSAMLEGNTNPVVLHFVATGLNSLGQEVRAEAQQVIEVRAQQKAHPISAAPPKSAPDLSVEVAALLRRFKRNGLDVAPDIPPARLEKALYETKAPKDEIALGLIEGAMLGWYSCLLFGKRGLYYCNPQNVMAGQPGPGSVSYADFPACEFKVEGWRMRIRLRAGKFLDVRQTGMTSAVNPNLIAEILNGIKALVVAR